MYELETSSLSDNKVKRAYITCDHDGIVVGATLFYEREEFDNIVSSLSGKFKLLDCTSQGDRSFNTKLLARFNDGDSWIIVAAPKNYRELEIRYDTPYLIGSNCEEEELEE
jgi:hypothetical protein